MGIIELIQRVGEENVKLQNLVESADVISTNKKGETRISFWTNQINAGASATGQFANIGLVLWLPKELVDKAKAEAGA